VSRKVRKSSGDWLTIALYSDDRVLREQVSLAISGRLADDLPPVRVVEFATAPALMEALEHERFDCLVLDAETAPLGGMGVSYQIKDEFRTPPPVVLLVTRQVDAWLATWSRADAVASRPIDPVTLPTMVADVIRSDRAGTLAENATVPGAASRHG